MSTTPGFSRIASDVRLGKDVKIHAFVNLYGCSIGDETSIGTFVEIQKTHLLESGAKSRVTLSFARVSRLKTNASSDTT
jgi:UDP-3-O-[3-hydroxymyristoyl] glucosamine N-acyltransferase